MGAALIYYSWSSLAVLYSVISRFLARLFFTDVWPKEPEDTRIHVPLFKAIVYSRSESQEACQYSSQIVSANCSFRFTETGADARTSSDGKRNDPPIVGVWDIDLSSD